MKFDLLTVVKVVVVVAALAAAFGVSQYRIGQLENRLTAIESGVLTAQQVKEEIAAMKSLIVKIAEKQGIVVLTP